MTISQRFQGGTVIITICGNPLSEPDLAPLKRSVRSHANSGIRQIILDFGYVRHINSSAVGSLLAIRKILAGCQGTLLLARMNDNLRKILERTGLLKHFCLFATMGDALAHLSA